MKTFEVTLEHKGFCVVDAVDSAEAVNIAIERLYRLGDNSPWDEYDVVEIDHWEVDDDGGVK